MKSLLIAILALPVFVRAQNDTTTTQPCDGGHNMYIGYSSNKGFGAHIEPSDSLRRAEASGYDTIRLEMKRKVITILTEPNSEFTFEDSIEDGLHALRLHRRNKFTYWSGIDVGLNSYVGPDGSMELDSASEFMELDTWGSRFISINFMEQKIEFGSHHVGLLLGLGLEWRNYLLTNNVALGYNSDSTYAVKVDEPAYKKNKLRQAGLRVPVLLEFNTKRAPLRTAEELRGDLSLANEEFSRKGNFHIALGVIGTWHFETMYKTKYSQDGESMKDRSSGSYNLQPLSAMATVRVGYGGLNLFAEYGLTNLFEDGKGPELTPVNIGLTLIGFN